MRVLAEKTFLMILGSWLTYMFSLQLLQAYMKIEFDTPKWDSSFVKNYCDINKLNSYERMISSEVEDPVNIREDLSSIVGQTVPKRLLQMIVDSKTEKPNGVILHGPPGTGKTMLARAFAKEMNCPLICISPDIVENKMFGESNKILRGIFSLAEKVKPCVIFIDEIDGLVRSRNSFDSCHVTSMKTMFLTLMEARDREVVLIGATNLIDSVDNAVKRRMRIHAHVGLPNDDERKTFLRDTFDSSDDIEHIIECLTNSSMSDLAEFARLYKMTNDVDNALEFFNIK